MGTQRGNYKWMSINWNILECAALGFVVAHAGTDTAAQERTAAALDRVVQHIAEITGQAPEAIRCRVIADAHDVVAVSTPMVVREGDYLTDPVTPLLVAVPASNLAPKARRHRGPGRKAKAKAFQVGDLVVQAFPEQWLAFQVTEINGSRVTGVQVNGSTPGRKVTEPASTLERVTAEDLAARIDVDVEAGGYRGRISQAIVTRWRGKFRVLCQCTGGLEICEPGSRRIAWGDTFEDAQVIWKEHVAGHLAAAA